MVLIFPQVLVTAHISPGVTPSNGVTWMYEEYNERINNLILDFSDVIIGMHFGHEHSDNFRVHFDDSGNYYCYVNKARGNFFTLCFAHLLFCDVSCICNRHVYSFNEVDVDQCK